MKLNKDLREFVELLNAENARYLLVGGHAVAFHGHPRFTGDIDFFVEPTLENGVKLARVFDGFGDLGFRPEDFTDRGSVIQLGRPPNRIGILPSIDGVEFGEAWAEKSTQHSTAFRSTSSAKNCCCETKARPAGRRTLRTSRSWRDRLT